MKKQQEIRKQERSRHGFKMMVAFVFQIRTFYRMKEGTIYKLEQLILTKSVPGKYRHMVSMGSSLFSTLNGAVKNLCIGNSDTTLSVYLGTTKLYT